MIPKIIHQTWKTESIPDLYVSNVNTCKRLNPSYIYKLWTDVQIDYFVKTEFPNIYPTWIQYKHTIQRVDAFRYMVLYTYGGIYLDLDIECKLNFDDLLHHELVIPEGLGKYFPTYYTNEFMMASQHNTFMYYCVENLKNSLKNHIPTGIQHIDVFQTTGPFFLTSMFHRHKPNAYVIDQKNHGGNCTNYNKGSCTGGTYLNHHDGGTWHTPTAAFINKLLKLYTKYAHLIVLLVLACIYYRYGKKK